MRSPPHRLRRSTCRASTGRVLAALLLAATLAAGCDGDGDAQAGRGAGDTAESGPAPGFDEARVHAVKLQDAGADPREVLAALQAAHRLNPDHYGINHRLARACNDAKLHDQALEHFLRAYAARPEDHESLLAIVTLQVRLGQLDEALKHLGTLEADPAYAGEARYQHATILDQRGERAAALALVADTAYLPGRHAYRCLSLHGRFLLEDGEVEPAQQRFRAALAGRPDYKEALKGMADTCRRLGQDAEAERWDALLSRFIALTDNIYARSPREREARRDTLAALLAEYPQWVEGFAELADLQLQLGDRPGACRTIESFLAEHGALTAPEAAAKLRARYCGGAAR